MSTRINNGHLLKKPSLEAVLKEFTALKPKAEAAAWEVALAFVARESCYLLDGALLEAEKVQRTPLLVAMDKLSDRQREVARTGHRDPEVDVSLNVTVFHPLKSSAGQRILAMSFCEHRVLEDFWKSLPFVSEYGYWNNTDRPEGVTAQQWTARRKAWDKVIPSGVPADSGFNFIFVPEVLFWTLSREEVERIVTEKMPTLENRARRIALDLIARDCDQQGLSISKCMARMRSAEVEERTTEMMGVLKAQYTYADLCSAP